MKTRNVRAAPMVLGQMDAVLADVLHGMCDIAYVTEAPGKRAHGPQETWNDWDGEDKGQLPAVGKVPSGDQRSQKRHGQRNERQQQTALRHATEQMPEPVANIAHASLPCRLGPRLPLHRRMRPGRATTYPHLRVPLAGCQSSVPGAAPRNRSGGRGASSAGLRWKGKENDGRSSIWARRRRLAGRASLCARTRLPSRKSHDLWLARHRARLPTRRAHGRLDYERVAEGE